MLVLCALWACGGGARDGHGGRMHGAAQVGGGVVSTVDGHPITVGDVGDLASRSGLPPAEALRKLQAERLLMIEAERREIRHDPAVDWVGRQAQAQALLDSVTSQASVSDAEVRAAYEQAKSRFEQPERRVAVHVLAAPQKQATAEDDAAARAFAAATIEPLAQAQNVGEFLAGMGGRSTPHFKVGAESLPAFDRSAALVPAFLEAMFSLPAPGVVPEPVRTVFGWHAIRVLEIVPPTSTPYAEAAEQLRSELLVERKKQIVDELIARARREHRVEFPGELRQTLAKLDL